MLTDSLEEAIQEAKEQVVEMQESVRPKYTRKQALEELGGKPVVYKLTLTKIKY